MTASNADRPPPVDPQATEEDVQNDAIIGRVFVRSLLVLGVALAIGGGAYFVTQVLLHEGAETVVQDVVVPTVRDSQARSLPRLPMTDVTEESEIDFVHHSGRTGEKLLPETMGSGVAVLDYNRDGHDDLLFVNSTTWPWDRDGGEDGEADAVHPPRLYAGVGDGTFRDVTSDAGLAEIDLYGMGVAVGDFDGDGWVDVYLTAVGANKLLRNDAGTFRDVTAASGTAGDDARWSSSAGFFDYNRDGRLDLFVCNYVTWSRDLDLSQSFTLDGQSRAYGPPVAFTGTFPYLFRNDGDGRFTDVSAEAGIEVRNRDTEVPLAKSLGLVPTDVNNDGWIDIVVVNDTVRNFLFLNRQDGRFEEVGETYNIAYDRSGNARGGMGADCAWLRDGQVMTIGIGNFANEASALYMTRPGRDQFVDAAMATGFGPPTRQGLTFGFFFFDVDLDGRLDMLGANGHLEEEIEKTQSSQRYAQPPQLFWNAGRGGSSEFVLVPPANTGEAFAEPIVGRGSTYGDFDGDGDLDVVITTSGGPPKVFRNDQRQGHHFLRFRLVGRGLNRQAIGASIRVEAGDSVQLGQVMPTRGYLSQTTTDVTFGLGETTSVDKVTVVWPDGQTQILSDVPIDQTFTVQQSSPDRAGAAQPAN